MLYKMKNLKLTLSILQENLAICRLNNDESLPKWILSGSFISYTRAKNELSIICPEENIPVEVKSEKGWRAIKIESTLDFSMTGVLASLASPLAEEKISIFVISTFDTDYILVKKENLKKAVRILKQFCIIKM